MTLKCVTVDRFLLITVVYLNIILYYNYYTYFREKRFWMRLFAAHSRPTVLNFSWRVFTWSLQIGKSIVMPVPYYGSRWTSKKNFTAYCDMPTILEYRVNRLVFAGADIIVISSGLHFLPWNLFGIVIGQFYLFEFWLGSWLWIPFVSDIFFHMKK